MMEKHTHSKETCRELISKHVKRHMDAGMDQPLAVAAAYSEAREAGCYFPPQKKK